MTDTLNLRTAIEQRGAFAVWDLMEEQDQREAAKALWENADRESRTALELALAKELKFRPQSVRRLPAEKVAGRLVKLAEDLGETVLFQYLFHLHMAARKPLLVEFLDAVKLPHDDGVLNLEENAQPPQQDVVESAAKSLLDKHGAAALVYFATLKVADADFWAGIDGILEGFDEAGHALEVTTPKTKAASSAKTEKKPTKKAAAKSKPAGKVPSAKASPKKGPPSKGAPSKVTKKTAMGKTTNK